MVKIRLIQAHVLAGLAILQDESVHCVVTSPPYWGLRDYGLEPQVWGGEEKCGHEWGDDLLTAKIQVYKPETGRKHKEPELRESTRTCEQRNQGNFCHLCGVWRGSFGLEPLHDCLGWATGNPCGQCYICHTVEIFREVRRVLRKDGVLFLNIGDSYSGLGGARGEGPNRLPLPGLKPKDLCGIPWRVALALQADGAADSFAMRQIAQIISRLETAYEDEPLPSKVRNELEKLYGEYAQAKEGSWWLRSDIIWSKPNPMPESCTDRPTTAHEHIFLLTKSAKYFYDAEAIREQVKPTTNGKCSVRPSGDSRTRSKENWGVPHEMKQVERSYDRVCGANARSVWTIATAPFPGAHFATFAPELVHRCVAAGTSEKGCCPKCGAPWKRVVEKTSIKPVDYEGKNLQMDPQFSARRMLANTRARRLAGEPHDNPFPSPQTTGWSPTCACNAGEPAPCTVLDPFSGVGTTGLVAAKLGRDAVLIELKPEYCRMAEARLKRELGMLAQISIDLNSEAAV